MTNRIISAVVFCLLARMSDVHADGFTVREARSGRPKTLVVHAIHVTPLSGGESKLISVKGPLEFVGHQPALVTSDRSERNAAFSIYQIRKRRWKESQTVSLQIGDASLKTIQLGESDFMLSPATVLGDGVQKNDDSFDVTMIAFQVKEQPITITVDERPIECTMTHVVLPATFDHHDESRPIPNKNTKAVLVQVTKSLLVSDASAKTSANEKNKISFIDDFGLNSLQPGDQSEKTTLLISLAP